MSDYYIFKYVPFSINPWENIYRNPWKQKSILTLMKERGYEWYHTLSFNRSERIHKPYKEIVSDILETIKAETNFEYVWYVRIDRRDIFADKDLMIFRKPIVRITDM